jgi:hypothetical protein
MGNHQNLNGSTSPVAGCQDGNNDFAKSIVIFPKIGTSDKSK